jgi:uncharacterized membrane protein YkvA (DUF1232 family)
MMFRIFKFTTMDELTNLFGGTEQIWEYIKKYAKTAGRAATKIVLELYYVVKSPDTPIIDKTIIITALAYQLLPEDLISSKKLGRLGALDNGAALILAYDRVKARVTPQIDAQVNAILNQWLGQEEVQTYEMPADEGRASWIDGPKQPHNRIPNPQPIRIPTPQSPTNITNNNRSQTINDNDYDVVID